MLTKEALNQFTGTEKYYKYFNLKLTDGSYFLAQEGQCFWLLDVILSYQLKLSHIHFQIWQLEKNEDDSAVITMKEDSDKPVLVKQRIPWTDFPLEEVELWLIDGVLILPSEY